METKESAAKATPIVMQANTPRFSSSAAARVSKSSFVRPARWRYRSENHSPADEAFRFGHSVAARTSTFALRLLEQRNAELLAVAYQLEVARRAAETAALQDPLTKLPNRQSFHNRLTQALQLAKKGSAHE